MKIGWKLRKLWNFEISQISKKQFLTSRYEYANERVDDVICLTIFHSLCIQKWQKFHISAKRMLDFPQFLSE